MGIRLVTDPESVSKSANCVVQTYLDKPLLINKFKFDLRLYVLVTSFGPHTVLACLPCLNGRLDNTGDERVP